MINNFNDFIGGGSRESSNIKKPSYIYVIEYIMSKDNYFDELKDYIINYDDDDSDYEDESSQDFFMKKLKNLAIKDNFDEIEEMISSFDEYLETDSDYDEDDDDFEEKMYNSDIDYSLDPDDDIIEEIEEDIENSNLSEQLKDFLKVDIEFEDLGKDENDEFESLGIKDIDFEIKKDDEEEKEDDEEEKDKKEDKEDDEEDKEDDEEKEDEEDNINEI